MDIFKFTNPSLTNLSDGELVNNYISFMWIERYAEPGEFELVANLSSGLQDFLLLGSMISHSKTYEVCIVENHEIIEDEDKDPIIKITGRSLDSFLDHRIVGYQYAQQSTYSNYILDEYPLAVQIYHLIDDHLFLNDEIQATYDGNLEAEPYQPRITIPRQQVSKAVLDLLAIDNLGIRSIRKSADYPYGVGSNNVSYLQIHSGIDKSDSVIFSKDQNEIKSANYLFSIKNYKTSALVMSKYRQVLVTIPGNPTGYARRELHVDASDLDNSLDSAPTGQQLTDLLSYMNARGIQALANQKLISIGNVNISKDTNYKFREDYNIGDIISISGNYNVIEKKRIIEYVEIEDETGEVGYPTLSDI